MSAPRVQIDPVTLEIYWNRLITVMGETDLTLLRTAMSTIVSEAKDFAFVLLDADGNGLAQSIDSLTVFTGILPYTARHLLSIFPPEELQDGDVLATNDPWIGAGHLPDFCFVKPVFHGGRLVAYMTCLVHMADVAGSLSYFGARDVFEEGVNLPPCKLYRAGQPCEEILAIIRANSRVPEISIGDMRAVISALHVATERLREFLNDYNLTGLQDVSASIRQRSEEVMRQALSAIPPGTYSHAVTIDGFGDHTVTIAVNISVRDGAATIDYAGSSAETFTGAINVCLNYTRGSTLAAIKSALTPEIPSNEGLFQPIAVLAPVGSILNCRSPVPVRGRSAVAVHACEAIFGALTPAIPDRVMAGSGTFWGLWMTGRFADGRPFSAAMLPNGGMGASGRKDGLSTTAFPWNSMVTPTEILENQVPLYLERKELLPRSAGEGCFRGGLGQRLVFRPRGDTPVTMSLRPVNLRFPPPGLVGGDPGTLGRVLLNGRITTETVFTLHAGDVLICELPGGGGFGSASQRSDSSRSRDTELGYAVPEPGVSV